MSEIKTWQEHLPAFLPGTGDIQIAMGKEIAELRDALAVAARQNLELSRRHAERGRQIKRLEVALERAT